MSKYSGLKLSNSYFDTPNIKSAMKSAKSNAYLNTKTIIRSARESVEGTLSGKKKIVFNEESAETERNIKKEIMGRSEKTIVGGIFEIFPIGVNYIAQTAFGMPFAVGFMITEHLMITTHKNIPTSEHALVSLIKFIDRPMPTFRLDPSIFFYTDYSKNFSISAFSFEFPITLHKSIRSKSKFKLFRGEYIKLLIPDLVRCRVLNIKNDSFTFHYIGRLLPGTPVFSDNLKLQGIYTSCSNTDHTHIATRIDIILSSLILTKNLTFHPELQELLSNYCKLYNIPTLQTGRLGDSKDLFYIHKRTCHIFQYSQSSRAWDNFQIVNISQFKQDPTWNFKDHCRLVYANDGSFIITGGNDHRGKPSKETLQVYPSSGVMQKKNSMQEERSAHCSIYRLGYVYVMGGMPTGTSCERLNMHDNKWEPIASLNKQRVHASAVIWMHDNFIMIVGGDGESGNSVERYSFQFDRWDSLDITLPFQFIDCGIYLPEPNKVAIFGGRVCEKVVVIEEDNMVQESSGREIEELFRVYIVDVLPHKLICVYPSMLVWGKNVVYFINERFEDQPEVFEYSAKRLNTQGAKVFQEIKSVRKLQPNIVYQSQLLNPSFYDVYY